MFKEYYALTKPGLIYGNLITVIGGFALAARGHLNVPLLVATVVGISLVIASGCVFNNYIDRDMDGKMERTKDRALVTGRISGRSTIIYGICLGVAGFSVLLVFTNILTALVALAGFFAYVVLYSLWWKRRSIYGPLVGSISGAVPPVVGYCAVSNNFDGGAILLFLILSLWQMPHFFAIAMYRIDDYAAASVPVLPVKRGMMATKVDILLYIILFTVTAAMLTTFGYTGYIYLVVAVLLGLAWLGFGIKNFRLDNDKRWARNMFFMSLVVMMVLFITMALDVVV